MYPPKVIVVALLHLGSTAFTIADGLYQAPVGDFENFLLVFTWANEFCCSSTSRQCDNLEGAFASENFTLHGLWPQYSAEREERTGYAWPEYCGICTNDEACPVDEALASQFEAEWDVYAPAYSKDTLARHEYSKHGSCQGGSQEEYFRLGIDMMIQHGTPELISTNVGLVVSVSDIQSAYGGADDVGLACTFRGDQAVLEAAYICFANDGGRPGERVPCTTMNILKEDYTNGCVTRGADQVLIPGVGQCSQQDIRSGEGDGLAQSPVETVVGFVVGVAVLTICGVLIWWRYGSDERIRQRYARATRKRAAREERRNAQESERGVDQTNESRET